MHSELTALATVIIIDLVLAGDNAVVVGMAAAGLPKELRRKAIVFGIGAAALLRIVFAFFTVELLGVIGLVLAGGLLLLWVAWKLLRELRSSSRRPPILEACAPETDAVTAAPQANGAVPEKTFGQALIQIVVADVSMSLDNVLAVAGTARGHEWALIIGLALSVALMGVAATFIARLLHRHRWIAYLGLILIAWVALAMIWDGFHEVMEVVDPELL
ncbi:MAG: TerC family protein [Bauldia sp.]|nr:TerC family protein [Bauldia sp.]